MTLATYLYFDGQCKEAFEFYKSVFGGDFQMIQTFGDGPPDMGVPDAEKDRIMHVSFPIGDSVLMGSDTVSTFGAPAKPGNSFAVSFSPKTKAEADKVFSKLFAGGNVMMEMQDMFWGAYFGQGTDRFGVNWMVNVHTGDG